MKKILMFVVVLMVGAGLMAQDMMMGENEQNIWVSGNAGLLIPFNDDATGSGFNFYVSGEYTNLFAAGPLGMNVGAELGFQTFSEGDANTVVNQIPVNVFINTDVGPMAGLPDGIGLKPQIGLGLFSVSDDFDNSKMTFGLYGGLGGTYELESNMRVGAQFRGYRVMEFPYADNANDFFNIQLTFDYMLPM